MKELFIILLALYFSVIYFYIYYFFIKKYPSLTNENKLTIRCFPEYQNKTLFKLQYKNKFGIWCYIKFIDQKYDTYNKNKLIKFISPLKFSISNEINPKTPQELIQILVFDKFSTIDDIIKYHKDLYKQIKENKNNNKIKNKTYIEKFWDSI